MKGVETWHVGALLLISAVGLGFMLLPDGEEKDESESTKPLSMELELGFSREKIPTVYTCDGQDISPSVSFSELPEETETVALIMDDPDAPTTVFDHWGVWNITSSELEKDLPPREKLEEGVAQSTNDFSNIGYSGPCPPTGTHSYRFRAYALDSPLQLEPGASVQKLKGAVEGRAIAQDTVRREY